MKKNLCLVAILSAFASSAAADPVDWLLNTDSTLDGNVTGTTDITLSGKIHSNQFYFVDENDPEVWAAVGKIEATSISEIGSGTAPRISFTMGEPTESTYYLGQQTDTNQYQGTWFGPNGTAGDFLLKPASTTPLPPTNDLVVSSATASSEGYGAAYGAAKAIDGVLGGNTTNVWFSAYAEVAPWLTLDMGTATLVTHYEWSRGYCNAQAWFPGTWTVQASNDNSSWSTVDVVLVDQSANYPLSSCTTFGEMNVVDSPDTYRYYRFNFTASPLSSSPGVAIGEIKVWN